MPTIERRVCPDGTVRFRVRVRLHGARTASKTFHRNTDAQSYVGTVRRKGRQQTSQTYCYRATSRLYLRPSAIRLRPRMSAVRGCRLSGTGSAIPSVKFVGSGDLTGMPILAYIDD